MNKFQLVIVFLCGFTVDAVNFTIQQGNTKNETNNGVVDSVVANTYEKFISNIVIGNPISQLLTQSFSAAFNNSYWCYDSYPCFQIGGPFISPYRPVSLPPFPPAKVNISFEIYTRRNPEIPFILKNPNNVSQIRNSNFTNSSLTILIVSGYMSGNGSKFLNALLSPFLNYDDYNVINVNWEYASNASYEQAVANIRIVGAMIFRFTKNLNKITGIPLSEFYCIGHSLGAHACGYAGQYFNGRFGRISGLDPAGPYFEETAPAARLDNKDALFVDVIHTDSGILLFADFGINQKIGDVDFYPNGGHQQPGCELQVQRAGFGSLTSALKNFSISCNHGRAIEYYAETIPTANGRCRFRSYPCSDYSNFLANNCNYCGEDNKLCAEMGFNAIKYAEFNVIPALDEFYLTTNAKPTFCKTYLPPTTTAPTVPTPDYHRGFFSG